MYFMHWAKSLDRYLEKHPGGLPWVGTWLGGIFVTLLPFLQHWLIWFPDRDNRKYLHGDFIEHFGPRGFIYQSIMEGHLPLWDPFKETGLPTLDYLFDIFNPLILAINLVFLEDGFMRSHASQINLVLHYSIGGLGAYIWVMSLGLGRTAAIVAGVVWSSCGFMLVKSAGHDTVIHTTAWAPYMFMFLDKARRTGSLIASSWAGFFLGMLFLGGHPQYFYYFSILLVLYAVYYTVFFFRRDGAYAAWQILWRSFAPLAIVALIIASPQLMHSVGKILGDGLARVHPSHDLGDLVFTGRGSGQVRFLPYFLFPHLERGHVETYVYAGMLPLIVGLMAFCCIRLKEEGYWKLVLAAGLVLFLGNSLGLHKVLIDIMPGYIMFRETERMIIFVHIALGMLAAYGLNWLLSGPPKPCLQTTNRIVAALAALILLALVLGLGANHTKLTGQEDAGWRLMLNSFTGALVLLGVVWWILARLQKGLNTPGLRLAIAALVILDLGFYHLPLTAIERKDFYPDPSLMTEQHLNRADFLKKITQNRPTRFYLPDGYVEQMASYREGIMVAGLDPKYLNRVFSRPYWDIRWRMKENPRFLDLWGAEYVHCYSPYLKSSRASWQLARGSQAAIDLQLPRMIKKVELLANANLTQGVKHGETLAWIALAKQNRIVAKKALRWGKEISGVKVSIDLPEPLAADEVLLSSVHPQAVAMVDKVWLNGKRIADRVRFGRAAMNLCKNSRALPLAFFVQRAAVLEPYNEYLQALTSVDPSRCVLFREAPPDYKLPTGPTADTGGSTELVSFEPQRVELKVKAQSAGYVVMSQTASYGWSASLDGKDIPIYKAYGFMCSVQVPPGNHTLVFTYGEPLVKLGLAIMPLGFIALIGFTLYGRRRPWVTGYHQDD